MLEEEGRRISSNPMTPLGRLRRWLRDVLNLDEPALPEDYQAYTRLIRLVKSTARSLLDDTELLSPQTPIYLVKPSKKTLDKITRACLFSKNVSRNGLCWLTTPRNTPELVNELSTLIHHYEAIAFNERVSRLVLASEDATERTIETALTWEKTVLRMHETGLLTYSPEQLFALALKDRTDFKTGLSPAHLTKVYSHHTEYFDPDPRIVYGMGELLGRFKGKGPLLAYSVPSNHTYYYVNPKKEHPARAWAMAIQMDYRDATVARAFFDIARIAKRLKPTQVWDEVRSHILSQQPIPPRKAMHTFLTSNEDLLMEVVDTITLGVLDFAKEKNRQVKAEIRDQTIGKATGIIHAGILKGGLV